jgi:hypothetical protein
MRGVSGSRWQIGEECHTLPYADDLVIAPAQRGRWLHQRIMAHALKDLAGRGHRYVVNLSASRATAMGSLKMRWRSSGGMRPVHRRSPRKAFVDRIEQRVRGMSVLWRLAGGLPAVLLPAEEQVFDSLDRLFGERKTAGVVAERAPRAAAMTALVRRLPYDGRIRHLRDEAWVEWRYANPLRSYRFRYAGERELDGYLVLQRSTGLDRGRVGIVDCEAVDETTRAALFAAALAGGFPELYAWASACGPEDARLLERNGFVATGIEYEKTILVRPVREEDLKSPCQLGGRRLDDAADWDLRMIYSMVG